MRGDGRRLTRFGRSTLAVLGGALTVLAACGQQREAADERPPAPDRVALHVESPAQGSRFSGTSITIRGTATAGARIDVVGVAAEITGPAAGGQLDRFSVTLDELLEPGPYRLQFEATKQGLRPSRRTLTVVRRPRRDVADKPSQPQPRCDRRNYAGACIPPYPPDLDCDEIDAAGFRSVGSDPHDLDDEDDDLIACEP